MLLDADDCDDDDDGDDDEYGDGDEYADDVVDNVDDAANCR